LKKKILLYLFILPLALHAQDEIDLSTIEELEQNLPSYQSAEVDDLSTNIRSAQERRYRPPRQVIHMSEIENSGTEFGSISAGIPITNVKTNTTQVVSRPIFVKAYRVSDENGFRYLINKNGNVDYKVAVEYFNPTKQETAMFVPPTRYKAITERKSFLDYDGKLVIRPEVGAGADMVSSSFVADILNDTSANQGYSSRFFVNAMTQWKLPVKIGATVHFERSFYKVDTGNAQTSTLSFGPMIRSRDFSIGNTPIRMMGQLRLSPFSSMNYETANGSGSFKFNTYAALAGVEFPTKNFLGEFTFSVYYQQQWFNLKNQVEEVKLKSNTSSNKSLGLMISQVF